MISASRKVRKVVSHGRNAEKEQRVLAAKSNVVDGDK